MSAIAIGELARLTGVKVPTIRYYESIRAAPVAVAHREQPAPL